MNDSLRSPNSGMPQSNDASLEGPIQKWLLWLHTEEFENTTLRWTGSTSCGAPQDGQTQPTSMTPKAEPSFQFDPGRPEPGLSFCFEYLEVRFPRNSGKCICDVNCPWQSL